MSLSLHNEVRIALCRDQVQLVSVACELTLTGKSYRVLKKTNFPSTENADSTWRNAINTLEIALTTLPNKPALARVTLSNHFMRYTMVPWSESLNNEAEELAYAKHCFAQSYGAAADSWELRMNHDAAGVPQLASAVERELLQALRALFERARIKLQSVQPNLMMAYNNCHDRLKNKDAWLLLFENGSLCFGWLRKGGWSSVRTIKVGADWLDMLPELLDREAYLNELDAPSNEVFVWAPEQMQAALPMSGKWKINKLPPMIQHGFAADYDARFAMAMG